MIFKYVILFICYRYTLEYTAIYEYWILINLYIGCVGCLCANQSVTESLRTFALKSLL